VTTAIRIGKKSSSTLNRAGVQNGTAEEIQYRTDKDAKSWERAVSFTTWDHEHGRIRLELEHGKLRLVCAEQIDFELMLD
jgi:hypothetical protein